MTDRPAPDRPDDGDLPEVDPAFQLASARHDGEAGDDERAGVDVAALDAAARAVAVVAGRVAEVPAPPAGLLDDHVAAALAEHDRVPTAADDAEPMAPVTSLDPRRPWHQRVPLGAVAAAVAVVALVGAIGFAAVGDDADQADTATAALESAQDDAAGDGADAAESFGTAGSGLAAGEREAFAGYDELAASLGDRLEAARDAPAASEEQAEIPTAGGSPEAGGEVADGAAGCDAIGAAGIDPARVELVLGVVVDGQLVTAVVHGADGERRLTAVDEATCAVVEDRSL